jgi:hypothetical protein
MAFWLWTVLAIVVVVIVIALLSRIRIRLRYSRSGQLDQLIVVFQAVYGLFHYQIIMPTISIRGWNLVYRDKRVGGLTGNTNENQKKRMIGIETIRRKFKSYRTIVQSTRQFKRWVRQFLKKVECTRWRLDFRVGTGDAAETAVLTGLLWALSGCASGVAGQLVTLKTSPKGQVAPNYSTTEFTVVWEADFRIRLGTALWFFIKLGLNSVHLGKAIRAWRSLLSNPKQV